MSSSFNVNLIASLIVSLSIMHLIGYLVFKSDANISMQSPLKCKITISLLKILLCPSFNII